MQSQNQQTLISLHSWSVTMQSAERSSRLERQKGIQVLYKHWLNKKKRPWLCSWCMFRWLVDPDELLKQWKVCLLSLLENHVFGILFFPLLFCFPFSHFLSLFLSVSYSLTHTCTHSHGEHTDSMCNTGQCLFSDWHRKLCLEGLCFPGVDLTSNQDVGVQYEPAFFACTVNVCDCWMC